MTTEIWTIIGTGIALAGLLLVTLHNFKADIKADIKALDGRMQSLDDRVRNQGERMARLEGLLEGLREAVTGRRSTT